MKQLSSKPYLLRAIYEWCADSGLTPFLSVRVDDRTRVPAEYVKNGEIVLNISQDATRNLTVGDDLIQFSARFNGVSRELSIPVENVIGIFAKENGQGLLFNDVASAAKQPDDDGGSSPPIPNGKPRLQIIK
ncbi:MAG TPA: ClpXP protease specificity-enhancing factor [Burkholderiales bacterium]|nr:ClpXP protease specificity-enhancing factor [Burkholderiales bacterium]